MNNQNEFAKANAIQERCISEQNLMQKYLGLTPTKRLEGYHINWEIMFSVAEAIELREGYEVTLKPREVLFEHTDKRKSRLIANTDVISFIPQNFSETTNFRYTRQDLFYHSLVAILKRIDFETQVTESILEDTCPRCSNGERTCYCEMD